jgi:hypothetical protein
MSATCCETTGRPQREHHGKEMRLKEARQASQTGTRLAVSRIFAQIRQGAGKTTETTASRAVRKADQTAPPVSPTCIMTDRVYAAA